MTTTTTLQTNSISGQSYEELSQQITSKALEVRLIAKVVKQSLQELKAQKLRADKYRTACNIMSGRLIAIGRMANYPAVQTFPSIENSNDAKENTTSRLKSLTKYRAQFKGRRLPSMARCARSIEELEAQLESLVSQKRTLATTLEHCKDVNQKIEVDIRLYQQMRNHYNERLQAIIEAAQVSMSTEDY